MIFNPGKKLLSKKKVKKVDKMRGWMLLLLRRREEKAEGREVER